METLLLMLLPGIDFSNNTHNLFLIHLYVSSIRVPFSSYSHSIINRPQLHYGHNTFKGQVEECITPTRY